MISPNMMALIVFGIFIIAAILIISIWGNFFSKKKKPLSKLEVAGLTLINPFLGYLFIIANMRRRKQKVDLGFLIISFLAFFSIGIYSFLVSAQSLHSLINMGFFEIKIASVILILVHIIYAGVFYSYESKQ